MTGFKKLAGQCLRPLALIFQPRFSRPVSSGGQERKRGHPREALVPAPVPGRAQEVSLGIGWNVSCSDAPSAAPTTVAGYLNALGTPAPRSGMIIAVSGSG